MTTIDTCSSGTGSRLCMILSVFLACAPCTAQQINGRDVILDGEGKLLSWINPNPSIAYIGIIDLALEFIRTDVQSEHGYPNYFCRPSYQRAEPHEGTDWFSNPSDVLSGFIHSYIDDYYAFTGDASLNDDVILFADYMIEQGSTPIGTGWAWQGCPYPQDFGGVLPPRSSDREGMIAPHLTGTLGRYYTWLYRFTEDTRFLTAAIRCADALVANVRAGTQLQSPWPYRVMPETNLVYQNCDYCADVIDPIELFDELIDLGHDPGGMYTSVRHAVWTWLFSSDGPVVTGNWGNFFEDANYRFANHCQINTGETARYCLENPDKDPDWQSHAQTLITQQESIYGEIQYGAMVMNEQIDWYYPMISHTARYASICALYYEMTGDAVYREKAYRGYNWSTYGSCPEKARVLVETITVPPTTSGWYTDCHGDFLQHIFAGLASVPDWAPDNESHLLRSTSIVQTITYEPDSITYRTFDADSKEVFRIVDKPFSVTVDGIPLAERTDLTEPGWTWESNKGSGVCRIWHTTGRNIAIEHLALPAFDPVGIASILIVLSVLLLRSRRR